MPDKERLRDNLWSILFFILILALAIVILILIVSVQKEEDINTIAGGVFIGPVDDRGWNQSHYEGLKDACDELDIRLEIKENVKENEKDCRKAVEELSALGANVIFLTSAGFGTNIIEVVESHPNIMFFTVSPERNAKNMTTYFGRIYQMRYMTGIVAGSMTKNNKLGFVGAKKDPQVCRGINAYYLGLLSVNPQAKLKVAFIDDWGDSNNERLAAERLVKEGVDVLTFHSSHPVTIDVAEENDIFSIGYNDIGGSYSDKYLTSVNFHWGVLYQNMLQDFLRGSLADDYWLGSSEGVVGISDMSPRVGKNIREKVNRASMDFDNGLDVFMGDLYDNEGIKHCSKGERIGDDALLFDMDWLLEGVEEIEN